jgi:hypothetical protein
MAVNTARWWQIVRYDPKKMIIKNEKGKVVEVDRGIDKENSKLVVGDEHAKEMRQ